MQTALSRAESWSRTCHVARRQGGVFTRGQALNAGLTNRQLQGLVCRQLLIVLHRGVYRVAGTPPDSRSMLWASLLSCGRMAHFCGPTAAALWKIDSGVRPRRPTVAIPYDRRVEHSELALVERSRHLSGSAVTSMDGIPLVSPGRTLLDLARWLDRPALDYAVADAVRQGAVTFDYLDRWLSRLGGRGGRPGLAIFRVVLNTLDLSHESILEAEHAAIVAGLDIPAPVAQYEVWDGPLLLARLDLGWPELKVGSEANGYLYHSARKDWQRDHTRRQALQRRGWILLEHTTEDIRERGDEVGSLVYGQVTQRLLRSDEGHRRSPRASSRAA